MRNYKKTLIFDLDQTLIDSVYQKTNFFNDHKIIKKMKFIIIDNFIVYLRPYTTDLLKYCNSNNINVGFWSSGSKIYVKQIVDGIVNTINIDHSYNLSFNNSLIIHHQLNNVFKPYIIWSRSDNISKGIYFDVINDKYITWNKNKIKYNITSYKDMNYLFDNTKANKQNTILIDNLPMHLFQNNPDNILIIPPFCNKNYNDNILSILLKKLKIIKQLKSSNFNMKYISPDNKFIYPTGYITNCISRNLKVKKSKSK